MANFNNLPLPLNSLVGRQAEIAEVARLLSTTRLLTLTGVGGCGKTRLALAVAGEQVQAYADGVWFVELAPLSDPTLVPQNLAQVLAVQEMPPRPLVEVLAEYLRPRAALLVLDNCEHLVLACARMAETLLRACPHLRILCTSREALGVAGEVIYQVPVLPAPDSHHPPVSTAGYLQFAAVQLFVERAASAQPSFALTGQNAGAVAQICQQVDGIPLAIELAASGARTLSAEEIAARLADGLRLLAAGGRTAPIRQQTLEATLDWSHALLTPPEQALLAHLSVFAGGWTLAAAEVVCRAAGAPVLDLLARLVDKSLVVANVTQGQASRYRLLEPVRQYARGRLAASGELAGARDRHLRFYLEWVEAVEPMLHGPQQISWLNSIEADYDNLRAAFEWALERDCTSPRDELCDAALRLAIALPSFCRMHSHAGEGRRWLAAAMAGTASGTGTASGSGAASALAAAALEQAAWLAEDQSDFDEAARLAGQSLALYRSLHDARGIARSLYHLAMAAVHRMDFARGEELVEESLRLYVEMGDREGVALAWERIGVLSLHQGDYSRARRALEQGLGIWRDLGHLWGIAWSLTLGALPAVRLRDYGCAQAELDEALPIWEALGDQRGKAICFEFLAEIKQGAGDLAKAGACYREALSLSERAGDRFSVGQCIQRVGTLAAVQRRWEPAARLFGAGSALCEATHAPLSPADRADIDPHIHRTSEALGPRRFAAAWQAGQAMTIEEAVADAMAQAASAQRAPTTPLQAAKAPYGGLTARERQVAVLVAQGRSNREIAELLVVTERTVAVHISNILAKLDFTSRTQIATWAIGKGLVQ